MIQFKVCFGLFRSNLIGVGLFIYNQIFENQGSIKTIQNIGIS